MKTQSIAQAERGWGDAAVDGLLAGVVAGLLMGAYLLIIGLLSGADWQAALAQFDPSTAPQPLTGALTHLAVSGVYGAIFGLGWRVVGRVWPRLPGWAGGFLFGVALWALAALVTASGATGGWLQDVAPTHFAVAHAIYGLSLGVGLGRRARAA